MKDLKPLTTEPSLTPPDYWDDDSEIETWTLMEKIWEAAPEDLSEIAGMIRYGNDDCEAGRKFRDLLNKYETIEEAKRDKCKNTASQIINTIRMCGG